MRVGKYRPQTPYADLPDFQQNCIIYGDEAGAVEGFFQWLETKKYKLTSASFWLNTAGTPGARM